MAGPEVNFKTACITPVPNYNMIKIPFRQDSYKRQNQFSQHEPATWIKYLLPGS